MFWKAWASIIVMVLGVYIFSTEPAVFIFVISMATIIAGLIEISHKKRVRTYGIRNVNVGIRTDQRVRLICNPCGAEIPEQVVEGRFSGIRAEAETPGQNYHVFVNNWSASIPLERVTKIEFL